MTLCFLVSKPPIDNVEIKTIFDFTVQFLLSHYLYMLLSKL